MSSPKLFDHRLRINIEPGMRVMIEEEDNTNSKLIGCYVKEIITTGTMHELGIKVICEDGKTGRVKHIGTESTFMTPLELILDLENRLRKLVVEELSKDDLDWWENIIEEKIKEDVHEKIQSGKEVREKLQIPEYPLIQETFFSQLVEIILNKGPWIRYFQKIFGDKNSILVKLTELIPFRNLPAHGKELTPHIEKKIQVYYDDIIFLIEGYYRNKEKN